MFLEILQVSQENTCVLVTSLFNKETSTQMFFCETCEIFRTTFFIEHLWWLLLCIYCAYCFLYSTFKFTIYTFFYKKLVCKKILVQGPPKIKKLLKLQKRSCFLSIRNYFLYCSWNFSSFLGSFRIS